MKSLGFGKRGLIILVFLLFVSSLAVGTTVFAKVHNDHSPLHVGNGWGICGGYGTKYLKEIPTEIESAIYSYLHIPRNSVGAITFGTEVTAVDPTKESSFPHSCTSPLVDIGGTDATIANILTTPQTYQAEVAKTLAKDRKRYSGVIPPGATKAIQILVSEYVEWPNYSGHDPYFFNLSVDGNYLLAQQHDLVLGYYPKGGWKGVFEYSRSDAPFQGYPPNGS